MISDSGISSRFVGKEREVHTQVKQSIFPGLPYLALHYSADRKLGENLGARLISNIQVTIVTRSWACSMRLAVYACSDTDSIIENLAYQV